MTVNIRVSEKEHSLIERHAAKKGTTVSAMVRRMVLEQIEDEIDREAYRRTMKEYRKNPKTYTLADVEKMCLEDCDD